MSFLKIKKRKLNEEEGSGRPLQEWWTERYGMIHRENKALCAMCLESVVCRTSSVKLAASFEVSKIIAKHGKPLSNGDYIKEEIIECASYLFEEFQNKDKVIQRIKDLPISRNTVKARVIKLHVNIQEQVKKDINACQAYSIYFDESTDVTSSARLAIIAKYSKGNEIHEELIKLATLPTTTTGADICQTVVSELRNAGVDLKKKIVSVTTDGAPGMTGKDAGFVTLFTGHVGHPLITFHCIVHQQALCSKNGLKELENIMKCVTKTVNFITARALNKRKIEQLLNEVQSSYSGLLMYNNVRG
ncbi:SCAN domain-containing protein 3 [Biomphalaria glabrata]|nr:SCAN domain-containing protein 3 [Biomphalaria glabrata]